MTNELKGLTFDCTTAQQVVINNVTSCPIPNGQAALVNYGFPNVQIWQWILVLVAMIVIYRCLAFLCLKFFIQRKKITNQLKPN